jgi:integrase
MAHVAKRETRKGVRYEVRYRAGDGRERSRSFRTRRDADRFLVTVQTDMLRGSWVDPQAGAMTLTEYALAWVAARPGLRPRTRETYEAQLRRHVLNELGDVRLNALTPRRVREWHSKLVLSGVVSANTAAKCYRVLRTILGTAVHDELIIANPCKVDGAGVERTAERPVATIPQVFAVADAMPGHLRVFVLLAGFCGLRLGELLGLERRHVNMLRSLVTIEQQEHQLRNGLLVIGPPKSDAGRRTIAVPAFLVAELEGHLEQYTAAQPEARVFRGERGGSLRRHVVQKYWMAARSTTDLPDNFRLHDLRHTANTLAAATGASTKELMHRMGHASSQAAIRYQHATRERDVALAFALDELVEASRGIPRDSRGMNAVRGPAELADEGAIPPLTRGFIGAGDENRTRVLSLGS